MKRFLGLLKYLIPYKGKVVQNIIFNVLGAFFTLFSFAMVMPFLGVLFENQALVTEPMEFELSTDYFLHTLNYYMSKIMMNSGCSRCPDPGKYSGGGFQFFEKRFHLSGKSCTCTHPGLCGEGHAE